MSWFLLLAGIALWWGGHLFKRVAPDLREGFGTAGKGLAAAVIVAGLVLMVIGYRDTPHVNLWFPPLWTVHLNNLLMLVAVGFFAVSHSKGALRARFRHPQLIAVKTWALAHLIVNGDLAALVLFGGLLAWAVAEVIAINRAEPGWTAPEPGPWSRDAITAAVTLVAFAVISVIHAWLGVWPFPGGM